MDSDYLIARQLQQEIDSELLTSSDVKDLTDVKDTVRNARKPTHQDKPMSIVDPQWELIDPTPDIHSLFSVFNERFFWGTLHAVEVRWSPRMTSCAGVCVYQSRAGFCSVRLSRPLLILRPRKDLVETLLHEMIHAYLFVTHNNRDRDGHGPEFHRHMNRINQEAGTRISVFHSFHAEVRNYQQHIWRCNGPCQYRAPFFGIVRRAMNRAPGPTDNWWAQHEATCGGKFLKCHEPEEYAKKKTKEDKISSGTKDIRSFFPVSGSSASLVNGVNQITHPGSVLGSVKKDDAVNSVKPVGVPSQPHIVGLPNPPSNSSKGSGFQTTGRVYKQQVSTNNVVGFKDLQTPGGKQISRTSTFGGKGQTLGGSKIDQKRPPHSSVGNKPISRNGIGGFGGMMSNKGSGTFVLTGKAKKVEDLNNLKGGPSPINKPNSGTINVFSGKGNVLGSCRRPPVNDSEHSHSQSSLAYPREIPAAQGSIKPVISSLVGSHCKTVKEDSLGKEAIVLSDDDSEDSCKICCPVCQLSVKGDINSHLDECLKNCPDTSVPPHQKSNSSSTILDISDGEEDINLSLLSVECPVCATKVEENVINAHLNVCMGKSFTEENTQMDVDTTDQKTKKPKCPMCEKEVLASELDDHLESCAACSLQDVSGAFEENFSDDDEEDAAVGSPSKRVSESGERLYPCPCCYNLVETSRMNEHLDSCLMRSAF